MKNNLLVIAIGIIGFSGIAYGAFSDPYLPIQGGTGTSTAPIYGQLLVGNAGGTYTLTATSSLGIATASGVLSLAQTYGTAQTGALTIGTSTASLFNGLTISNAITNVAGAFTIAPDTITGTLNSAGLTATGVTSGTYGTATSTPQLTVNSQGQLTLVANVPIAIPRQVAYYAYATQATSSAAYFNMNEVASSTTSTLPYVLSVGANTVQNWITPVGVPGVTDIPGGIYSVDLFAWRSSGSASITLEVQIWEVSSTGADVSLIATTNSTANLTGTKAQYSVSVTTGNHTMASSANRILMRVIATSTGTPTLSLAMGDGDQMDLITPGVSVDASTFVPYTGATKSLDLGAYNASTTQLTVSGNTYLPLTGLLKGNGAGNALTVAANGTDFTLLSAQTCGAGQHISALTAIGGSTCSADSGSLTGTTGQIAYFSGTNTAVGTSTMTIAADGTVTIDNGRSSDSQTTYGADNAHEWSVGRKISDYSFNISSSTTLGTSDVFKADKSLNVYFPSLVTNGFVKTSGGTGVLSIDTSTYLTAITGGTCTNQFARAISTAGAVTCSTVANTDLTNSTISGIALGSNLNSLSVSGSITGTSYNGSAAVSNWALNMANANSFTALQSFSNATSTQFSAGSASQFYIDSTGHITAKDTVNAWSGIVSPTRSFVLIAATSTPTWTATSTPANDVSPALAMPFAGTLRQMRCPFNTFLGVNVQINGANVTPSYIVASSTVGLIKFTGSNTFNAGDKVAMIVGTTTNATVASGIVSGSCTFDATETP